MRIIISPAKNMRDYQSLNMKIDTPIFIDKAKNILSKLKALSEYFGEFDHMYRLI